MLHTLFPPPTSIRVAIGAGGTGGHIYPGLAIAAALADVTDNTAQIDFFGVDDRLETSLVPEAGYRLHTSRLAGLGKSTALTFVPRLIRAAWDCARLLRANDTDVVIGMGGYPSAPVVLGARFAGIPTIVHESNASPGRANRFGASIARRIATSFDAAGELLPSGIEVRKTGTPLLPRIARLDMKAVRAEARESFNLGKHQSAVFVVGGSLGARTLTNAALELAALWRGREDVRVIVKTGPAELERVRRDLRGSRVVSAHAYLDRMDLVYAAADVMVCRAGAATISELTHLGVPSILVPFPGSAGHHQEHNARVLSDAGGAQVVDDRDLTGESLGYDLDRLLTNASLRRRMANSAMSLRHPNAAHTVARWACEVAGRDAATLSAVSEVYA